MQPTKRVTSLRNIKRNLRGYYFEWLKHEFLGKISCNHLYHYHPHQQLLYIESQHSHYFIYLLNLLSPTQPPPPYNKKDAMLLAYIFINALNMHFIKTLFHMLNVCAWRMVDVCLNEWTICFSKSTYIVIYVNPSSDSYYYDDTNPRICSKSKYELYSATFYKYINMIEKLQNGLSLLKSEHS